MSKNIKSPPQLSPRPPVLFQKFRGLCFELIAATEGGLVLNYISPPSVMPSPGGRGPERRQHVMLFLASCSEGFVRKLGGDGGILSMAVSMWGAGYNGDGFSRQSYQPDLGH